MSKIHFPQFGRQEYSPFEMRQLIQALELRFQNLESNQDLSLDTTGGVNEFAPLGHTHTEADITDLSHVDSIFELSDVTGTPAVNDRLVWNGTAFETQPPSASTFALNDLTDVDSLGATDGQTLTFNSATLRWIPVSPSAGSDIDTLVELLDTDLTGQVVGDILFNADGTEWQATGLNFQWDPVNERIQLGNDIGINWYDVDGLTSVELATLTSSGVPGAPLAVTTDTYQTWQSFTSTSYVDVTNGPHVDQSTLVNGDEYLVVIRAIGKNLGSNATGNGIRVIVNGATLTGSEQLYEFRSQSTQVGGQPYFYVGSYTANIADTELRVEAKSPASTHNLCTMDWLILNLTTDVPNHVKDTSTTLTTIPASTAYTSSDCSVTLPAGDWLVFACMRTEQTTGFGQWYTGMGIDVSGTEYPLSGVEVSNIGDDIIQGGMHYLDAYAGGTVTVIGSTGASSGAAIRTTYCSIVAIPLSDFAEAYATQSTSATKVQFTNDAVGTNPVNWENIASSTPTVANTSNNWWCAGWYSHSWNGTSPCSQMRSYTNINSGGETAAGGGDALAAYNRRWACPIDAQNATWDGGITISSGDIVEFGVSGHIGGLGSLLDYVYQGAALINLASADTVVGSFIAGDPGYVTRIDGSRIDIANNIGVNWEDKDGVNQEFLILSGGEANNVAQGLPDVNTLTYDATSTSGDLFGTSYGLWIAPDGATIYVGNFALNQIDSHPLSTPWDVTTVGARSNSTPWGGSAARYPVGLWFSDDGLKVFWTEFDNDRIVRETLTTAYALGDITGTPDQTLDNVTTATGDEALGLWFNVAGTRMAAGSDTGTVHLFELSTAWDLTTATRTGDKDVGTTPSSVSDVTFDEAGTKMWVTARGGSGFYQWSMATPWDIANATYDTLLYNSNDTTGNGGTFVEPTLGYLFVITGGPGNDTYLIERHSFTPENVVNLTTNTFIVGDPAFDTQIDGTTTTITGDAVVNGATQLDTTLAVDGITSLNNDVAISTTLDAATGDEVALQLDYITNKATSGADTGFQLSMTDTLSPGTSLFASYRLGTTPVFTWSTGGEFVIDDNVNARIHIKAGTSGGTADAGTRLLIEDNTTSVLEFLSPNTFSQYIYFSDADATGQGSIQYAHSTDSFISNSAGDFVWRVAGTERARFDTSGVHLNNGGSSANDLQVESDLQTHMLFVDAGTNSVGIGTSAPGSDLDVWGDFRVTDTLGTDYAAFSHDGTDFNTAFTLTTDWNITGLTGDLKLNVGVPSINFSDTDGTGFPRALVKIGSALGDTITNAALDVRPDVSSTIQKDTSVIVYNQSNNDVNNKLFGMTVTNTIAKIGSSSNLGNDPGTDIAFTTQAITGTDYDMVIREADRRVDFLGSGGLRVYDGLGTDYAQFTHDGANFYTTFFNTSNWDITGLTAAVRLTGSLYINGGNLFRVNDSDASANWTLQHNGTDMLFTHLATTNWSIADLTGNVWIRDGAGLQISDAGDTDYATFSHDGTDFNTDFTLTADWNITGLTGSVNFQDGAALTFYDSANLGSMSITKTSQFDVDFTQTETAGTWSWTGAQYWELNKGASGNMFLRVGDQSLIGGQSSSYIELAGENSAGTTKYISRFQQSSTGPLSLLNAGNVTDFSIGMDTIIASGNSLFIRFGADEAEFYHDGVDFNTDFVNTTDWNILKGTSVKFFDSTDTDYFGILHDGVDVNFLNAGTGEIKFLGDVTVAIYDSTGIDAGKFSHDGTDFNADFTGTADWNVTGLTNLRMTGGNLLLRAGGDLVAYDSTNTDFVSLSHDGTDAVIGTSGAAALSVTGVATLDVVNYSFDVDQTVGAGQDNYVLTYDNVTGLISLEAASGGGPSAGTTTDSMLRWDGAAWSESLRVRTTSAGQFRIYDLGNTDFAEFDHNGTDFFTDFTLTGEWYIGQTGNLTGSVHFYPNVLLRAGAFQRIYGGSTNHIEMRHDNTDMNFDFTGTTDLNLNDGIQLKIFNTANTFATLIWTDNVTTKIDPPSTSCEFVDARVISTYDGGNNAACFNAYNGALSEVDTYQVYFSYQAATTQRHGIRSQHDGTNADGNSIDFMIHDAAGADADQPSIFALRVGADTVDVRDGLEFRVMDSTNADDMSMSHDGTDFTFASTNTSVIKWTGHDFWQVDANVGLTADVGSAQGNGVITSSHNVYSTVANAGDAATLPSTFAVGHMVYVKNDGANSMDVFPASGDDAGAGTNTAVAVAAGNFAVFMGTVADTTWTKVMGGTA